MRATYRLLALGILALGRTSFAQAVQSIQSSDGTVSLQYKVHPPGQSGSPSLGLSFVSVTRSNQTFALTETDVWSLRLRKPDTLALVPGGLFIGDGLLPSGATSFGRQHLKGPDAFLHRWTNVSFTGVPNLDPGDTFDVDVTARAYNAVNGVPGWIGMSISVSLDGNAHAVHFVVFPRVGIEERVGGSAVDQILAVPEFSGVLIPDPIHNASPLLGSVGSPVVGGTNPGRYDMQFFAYYNKSEPTSPLLYLATKDTLGELKEYQFEKDPGTGPGRLFMRVKRLVGNGLTATSYSSSYPFVLTVLNGDWYDAARHYRTWATSPGIPWTSQGPMRSDAAFPQELKDAQMILYTTVGGCDPAPSAAFPDALADYTTFQYWAAHINDHKSFFGLSHLLTLVNSWEQKGLLAQVWRDWHPAQAEFRLALEGTNGVNSIAGHSYVGYFNPIVYSLLESSVNPAPISAPCTTPTDDCAIRSSAKTPLGALIRHVSDSLPMLDHTQPCDTSAVDQQPFYYNVLLDQRSTFIYKRSSTR